MKTYVVTAHIPRNGDPALVTIVTPSGQIFKREPIQPSYVHELEDVGYAVTLMRRMFPVSGHILGDRIMFDTGTSMPLAISHGRVIVWLVDVEGKLPAV